MQSTVQSPAELAASVEHDGFVIVEAAVPAETVAELRREFAATDGQAGLRNLLARPLVREVARSARVRCAAEAVLGPGCFAVRAILFNKTRAANWKVPWHQDLTIAVRCHRPANGFSGWSRKEGVVHVQPPVAVLERMLAVRVHLDDCFAEHGPLRVLPGSHRCGRLDPPAIDRWKGERTAVECLTSAGGLILMRPLLLHASSPARSAGERRVVHLDFAAGNLPGGLEWFDVC